MDIDYKIQKYTTKLNYYLKLKQKGGSRAFEVGDKVEIMSVSEDSKRENSRFDITVKNLEDYIGKTATIVNIAYTGNFAVVIFDKNIIGVIELSDLQLVSPQLQQPTSVPALAPIQYTKAQSPAPNILVKSQQMTRT